MSVKKKDLIKFDQVSRRMFIKSVGGGLVTIPLLESFIGEKAFAQVAEAKRFIAVTTPDNLTYGYSTPYELGRVTPANYTSVVNNLTDPLGWNYKQTSLQSIISRRGQISDLLDTKFNSLASQILLYRGLDFPGRVDHGRAPALGNTMASQLGRDEASNSGNYTIDEIMANSSNFYENGRQSVTRDIVRLGGNSISTNSIVGVNDSQRGKGVGGANAGLSYNGNLRSALNDWFSSSGGDPGETDPKKSIVDRILASVNTIKNRSGVGSADLLKLEEYQDTLNELSQRLDAAPTNSCSSSSLTMPDQNASNMGNLSNGASLITNYYTNLAPLLSLAIKCGITKIATVGVNSSIGISGASAHGGTPRTWHLDYGHGGNFEELLALNKWIVDTFIYTLANELNVSEGSSGSTYLDNTCIYFTPECSYGHSGEGMAGFVLGGSNLINTGSFFDYGNYDLYTRSLSGRVVHRPSDTRAEFGVGLPINRLHVSFMRAMGLDSSDYINRFGSSGSGYGFWRTTYPDSWESYHGSISRQNIDAALPGFLKI